MHFTPAPGYVPPAPGYAPPAPGYVPSAPGYAPPAPSQAPAAPSQQKVSSDRFVLLFYQTNTCNTVECLIFAITLLREFREAPSIRQNKIRQI